MAEYDKILKGRKNPISGNMEAQLVPTIPPSQIDELDTRADELDARITAVEESGYGGTFHANNGELHYIKSVIVPDGTKKIGQMFKWYSEEHPSSMPIEIFVPEGVEEFGDNMLNQVDMTLSTDGINLPSTLKRIGSQAFDNAFPSYSHCFFEQLELPEGLETLGYEAFYGLATKHVIIPSSLNEIETGSSDFGSTFQNSYIEKITFKPRVLPLAIPKLFTSDRTYGSSPDHLKEINLAEGITSIGINAFQYNNCKTITIPSTVTSIGDNAFYKQNREAAWETITIEEGDAPLTIGKDAFGHNNTVEMTHTIYVPARCVSIDSKAFKCYTRYYGEGRPTIYVNKPEGSLEGAPWGAEEATVIWTG